MEKHANTILTHHSTRKSSERKINESMVTGVLCILELFRDMLPEESKKVLLGNVFTKLTAAGNEKGKRKSKKNGKPKDKQYLSAKTSLEGKIKRRKCISTDDNKTNARATNSNSSSVLSCNKSVGRPLSNGKMNGETKGKRRSHAKKDIALHGERFPFPKRDNVERKDGEIDTNQLTHLTLLRHVKTANGILGFLLKPNTKKEKIQSIQKLKKDKMLMSIFLNERRKLGKRKIPVLLQKRNGKSQSFIETSNSCSSWNREIGAYQNTDNGIPFSVETTLPQNNIEDKCTSMALNIKQPTEFKQRFEKNVAFCSRMYSGNYSNETMNHIIERNKNFYRLDNPNKSQNSGVYSCFPVNHVIEKGNKEDCYDESNISKEAEKDDIPFSDGLKDNNVGRKSSFDFPWIDFLTHSPLDTYVYNHDNHQKHGDEWTGTNARNELALDISTSHQKPDLDNSSTHYLETPAHNLQELSDTRYFQTNLIGEAEQNQTNMPFQQCYLNQY